MLHRSLLLALLLLGTSPAHAADKMANEASVRQLLSGMQAEKMLEGIWTQVETMMEASMRQATAAQRLTAAQQKVVDEMRVEMVAILKDELSWSKYEPMMLDIYGKSFTEGEVQGMLEFYRTPAGQAVIAKMPMVMQASMQHVQARMGPLQARMKKLVDDSVAKMNAAK